MAQTVRRLSTMQETWARSLGQEDPLEKKMATHSSILAWRIPWVEEPGGLQSMESDMTERLTHNHTHTAKGFGIVNKAEIDVFLELSCFFDDPADVGNLISGSSAFSKTSLNIWKFTVHVLLKPVSDNFEYYFTSV